MLKWWNRLPTPLTEPAAFEVVCSCGAIHRGERQHGHQVVRCTGCGKGVFVLPLSPLAGGGPAPAAVRPAKAPPAVPPKVSWRPWLWPVVAAAITLLLVTGAFTLLLVYLCGAGPGTQGPLPSLEQLQPSLVAGRQALLEGDFRHAQEKFDLANAIQERHSQALTPAGRRNLAHLQREARLLADWPRKSLEEMFREIANLDDHNWQLIVTHRYRGQAVVIDVVARHESNGTFQVATRPSGSPGPSVHLHLEGLRLREQLPPFGARRLLLGARLAEAHRENDVCDVYFEPDSGVLLTDTSTAALGLPPVPEAEWKELMRQQHDWVGD